jgi:ABC-type transport system, involved in lipoprotein release, permease component
MIRGARWNDLPTKKLLWKSLSEKAKANYKNKKQILIGKRLGRKLNVSVGEKITLLSANGIVTALGSIPQKQSFIIGGFFDVGMYEYDENFIYLPWEKAESFLITSGKAHNLEIFLKNPSQTLKIKELIQREINKNLKILDWKERNNAFINALNVEKNVMFLILSLIILVAAFNIISSMIMLVNNKKSDIALLRTMGATKITVIKIFILVGSSIGFIGTFVGTLIGIYLSVNIEFLRQILSFLFSRELFSPEIYFLTNMPSEINFNEVFYIIITSLLLTLIASVIPSGKHQK